MSRQDVKTTRAVYEAWNRGDLDRVLTLLHPDHEFRTSGVYPGLNPVYRGHDGFRKFWRDFRDAWESLDIEVHEVRDLGERVVALCTFKGSARDGMVVERPAANVYRFRNRLVVRSDSYGDWHEALEAVGLSE
jgi:ketosteroid isomerase-like protein